MPHAFEYDIERAWPFVTKQLPGLARADGMTCIGLLRDGEIVAVMVWEGFNGVNIWGHLVAEPGSRWMTRNFLRSCFVYAFDICKVKRISGYVNESNYAAVRLDEHLGFTVETKLKGAAPDGGDVLIYVMRREDCRFIKEAPNGS